MNELVGYNVSMQKLRMPLPPTS